MTPANVRMWGQVVVGTMVLLMFLAVLLAVYQSNDSHMLDSMVGYVAGFASAVVMYYFGSSVGSAAKDEKMQPPPTEPAP